MSDSGEGTPPPPPPYGGGSQGGQYGQPYEEQAYGSPPQQPASQNPYGAPPPPPSQPYGSPPSYGPAPSDPSGYGQQQPYGSGPAPYGGYGAMPGAPQAYGTPHGAPAGMFGTPATMGQRLAARIIDVIILLVVVGALGALFIGGAATQVTTDPVTGEVTSGGGALAGAIVGYALIIILFGLFYEVAFIALRGATLGKQAMGIKVVRESDGQIPGWGPAALRWIIPQVAGMICGLITILVYVSPFFDNTGRLQGWHDKVAKTFVVKR